jgi:predicted Zn-dependent protease
MRSAAERALRLYTLASGPGERWGGHGGVGLADTPRVNVRIAWLHLALGEHKRAAEELARLLGDEPNDQLAMQLARVHLAMNQPDAAMDTLRDVCRRRPSSGGSRDMLCRILAASGRGTEAEALLRERLRGAADDSDAISSLGKLLVAQGRAGEAIGLLKAAAGREPSRGMLRLDLAGAMMTTGDAAGALVEIEAAAADPRVRGAALQWGERVLRASGRAGEVEAWRARVGGR